MTNNKNRIVTGEENAVHDEKQVELKKFLELAEIENRFAKLERNPRG